MKLAGFRKIRSFRSRMALLSAAISGGVLVIFAAISFTAVQRINLSRMDKDIREFSHRHLLEPSGSQQWNRMSEALTYFFGGTEEEAFILLIKGGDGEVIYASNNWPDSLPAGEFPSPSPVDGMGPGMPAGEQRPSHGQPLGEAPRQPLPGTQGRPTDGQQPGEEPSQPLPGSQGRRPLGPGRFGPPPRAGRPGPPGPQGRFGPPEAFGPPNGRLAGPPEPAMLKEPEFGTHEADGARWRIGVMGSPSVTMVLGLNLKRLDGEMTQVRNAFLLALPLALLLVAAGAWLLSQRALKPIRALTTTVEQVTAKGLDQRVMLPGVDEEFTRLVTVFNEMMERLEHGFHQAVRFSADASHELKTPLAILQGQLEQALNAAEPGSEEQRRYGVLAKEVQRLKRIVKKLLLLSRVDAGELRLNLRPLSLSELVEGTCEDAEILAPHLEVKSEVRPNLWVMADPDLIKQVVQNLATNAIKYNVKGGVVHVHLRGEGENVRCFVANSGKGIPQEARDKVFTRFFRADKARSRQIGGVGLGLSLAREIVRAHQGELRLEESPDGLTVFSMVLPRAEAEGAGVT